MKKRAEEQEKKEYRVFVTGAKNRRFSSLIRFCKRNRLTRSDVIIILGDAGINYYGDHRDDALKAKLSSACATFLCIHGNEEMRPKNIGTYKEKSYMGGKVMYEKAYPYLLFAVDCSIYRFAQFSAAVIGGAHSKDKFYRLENHLPYWEDEEPDAITRRRFARVMKSADWQVDLVLSHAAPISFLPQNASSCNIFCKGFFARLIERIKHVKQKYIKSKHMRRIHIKDHIAEYIEDPDLNVELWLDEMERKMAYQKWYAGHYHIEYSGADIVFVHNKIIELRQ